MEWTFTTNVDTEALAESLCENKDFKREIAGYLNTYEIANELSVSDIAYEIDTDDLAREIAGNIDDDDIARCIDLDDLAGAFDVDELCEKIAENMPDGTASNDMSILTQRVDTLTRTVERLMGVLDWSLENMRRGVVLTDGGTDFTLGTGIYPAANTEAPTNTGWNERPNYL
jgi:hypothetical protein